MSTPPETISLYHITHVQNLARIARDGLLSDAAVRVRGGPSVSIGMPANKERRLSIPVRCHAGDFLGDYVPFNFCPRSVMLYILGMGNHPDIEYRDGQEPLVHLEFDLDAVVEWAASEGRRWAFTSVNASAAYATFYDDLELLDEISWAAVASNDFGRASGNIESKQAEFLVRDGVPWELVNRVGVASKRTQALALAAMADLDQRPDVSVIPHWYF
jgi:hypothetical protein